jgi:hypothetical protein
MGPWKGMGDPKRVFLSDPLGIKAFFALVPRRRKGTKKLQKKKNFFLVKTHF